MFGFEKKRDEFADYYSDNPEDNPEFSQLTPSRQLALLRAAERAANPHGPRSPRMWPHFAIHILVLAIIVGAVRMTAGEFMTIKLVKEIATPIGVAWVALFMTAYALTICRCASGSIIAWIAWLVLTLGGNDFIAHHAASSLEQSFMKTNPMEMEKFDVVVVLGGGTLHAPNGVSQLTRSGDRIMMAARLYNAKKVERIVCTGTSWQPLAQDELQVNEQAREILSDLDIPQDKLVGIRGKNTSAELESFSQWLDENPTKRIGLITSAWHLPRALQIAKKNNIEAIGIPSDFYTEPIKPGPNLLVPGSDQLQVTTRVVHEYLGRWFGK